MQNGLPSFDNTEIAFGHKSKKSLKNAIMLFSAFKFPFIVNKGPFLAGWALKIGIPVKGIIKNTIFKQFCGGESVSDCDKTMNNLAEANIGTILDYSVEGENTEDNLDFTRDEILKTAITSANTPHIPFCVFKVTGVIRFELLEKIQANSSLSDSEEQEYQRGKERVSSICCKAKEAKTKVLIDAEESWIQNVIDDIANEMMESCNQEEVYIFNTIQLYRHDRLEYLKNCIKSKSYLQGYKLVRGAYMEKERERAMDMGYASPIQKDKASTDKDYNKALKVCILNIDKVELCAGTHNEESSLILCELMKKYNISKEDKRVYSGQLLGMSDHISYNLAHANYNVAKYVPYGPVKSVMPYLGRRAKENSSIGGQVGRELQLLKKELKRRA